MGAGAGRQQQQPFHAPARHLAAADGRRAGAARCGGARRPVGGRRGGVGVPAPAPAVAVGALCGEMKGRWLCRVERRQQARVRRWRRRRARTMSREPSQVAAPAPRPARDAAAVVEQGGDLPGASGRRHDREAVPRPRQPFPGASRGQGHLPLRRTFSHPISSHISSLSAC